MKHILITGKNSYIGNSLEALLAQWPAQYRVSTLDLRDEAWQTFDFAGVDCIFHVAALVHRQQKMSAEEAEAAYFKVNAQLPEAVAKKAKAAGVRQFIFMSSMSVYGQEGSIKRPVTITKSTQPAPNSPYGRSKLAAEAALLQLQDADFRLAILRPPMVYGPGSPGNYQGLVKAAKLPFFPDFPNQRSMLHIDGLVAFVKRLIDENSQGLFFPQDKDYACTSKMVQDLAQAQGKSIRLTRLFNPLIRGLSPFVGLLDKVFGDLVYQIDQDQA